MKKITGFSLILFLVMWLMPLDVVADNTGGDVNNDGEVNIADVNTVINFILGDRSRQSVDVNNDGEINIADVNAIIGIILNAKYRVEKDHQDIGVIIPLDDEELKPLMTKALRRYFNALRSNEKHIKNVENYLYGTMQNLFGVWWNKQAAREYAAKHPNDERA